MADATWLIRPDPDDMWSFEINLNAGDDCKVPLVVGQTCRGVTIKETRMYTIRELKELIGWRR